ncbi:uncharacterized protein LOC128720150 [Anopheles nili]|uniref:uncharacterized protein LOC128720150 n=1 Tax=Anopheles nili TaxID=185578 RepID=UPI00237ACA14|nr:uncharacterized protein LOC128720150 [Anopheles nili]
MNKFTRNGFPSIVITLFIAAQTNCNPLFFYPPSYRASSNTGVPTSAAGSTAVNRSNVTVAVGNRINTVAALDDYGTRIDGLTLNVDRRRRRRRDIWNVPSLLGSSNIPNGSFIAIDNHVFPLPNNLSNVSLNIGSIADPQQVFNLSQASFAPVIPTNYTNAFQQLMTGFETAPLNALDNIVRLLTVGYQNTLGQLFLEQGLQRINQTLNFGNTVVRNRLDTIANQTDRGFEQIIAQFNSSTHAVQQCVGDALNPSSAARTILNTAYTCVNRKWQELVESAMKIAQDIVAADTGSSQFLTNLTACNVSNLQTAGLTTSQITSLRRQCYRRAIGSFPQSLLLLPITLAIDGTKLYSSTSGLQVDLAACSAEVAVAVGTNVAQIGAKILLCQLFPTS